MREVAAMTNICTGLDEPEIERLRDKAIVESTDRALFDSLSENRERDMTTTHPADPERIAFEAWYTALKMNDTTIEPEWDGWQARAALAAAPVSEPATSVQAAQQDMELHMAVSELAKVMGNPAVTGHHPKTVLSETVRLAAQRLAAPPASPQVQASEPPIAWWNGIRPTCDEADVPAFKFREDTWHDIPVYAGVNPCNLVPPAEVPADERDVTATLCRDDGRCQYAIDHGAEGMGHCSPKCCMPRAAMSAHQTGDSNE